MFRRDEETLIICVIPGLQFLFFSAPQQEVSLLPELLVLWDQIHVGTIETGWTLVDGLILYNRRIFLAESSLLWPDVLDNAHDMGHEGIQKTLHRFRASFFNIGAH